MRLINMVLSPYAVLTRVFYFLPTFCWLQSGWCERKTCSITSLRLGPAYILYFGWVLSKSAVWRYYKVQVWFWFHPIYVFRDPYGWLFQYDLKVEILNCRLGCPRNGFLEFRRSWIKKKNYLYLCRIHRIPCAKFRWIPGKKYMEFRKKYWHCMIKHTWTWTCRCTNCYCTCT